MLFIMNASLSNGGKNTKIKAFNYLGVFRLGEFVTMKIVKEF